MFPQKISLIKKKAIGLGCFAPPMASGTFGSGCLRGAGYDDQNNNDYRNGDSGKGATEPTCETGKHGQKN